MMAKIQSSTQHLRNLPINSIIIIVLDAVW